MRNVWRSATSLSGLALLLAAAGCSRSSPPAASDAQVAEGGQEGASMIKGPDALAIAHAEDVRRAKDVSADARTSHDVTMRRHSARALARIADAASVDGL